MPGRAARSAPAAGEEGPGARATAPPAQPRSDLPRFSAASTTGGRCSRYPRARFPALRGRRGAELLLWTGGGGARTFPTPRAAPALPPLEGSHPPAGGVHGNGGRGLDKLRERVG